MGTHRLAELDHALRLAGKGYAEARDGSPEQHGALNNLAITLYERFLRKGDGKDLREALTHGEHALRIASPQQPEYRDYLANMEQYIAAGYARGFSDQDALARANSVLNGARQRLAR